MSDPGRGTARHPYPCATCGTTVLRTSRVRYPIECLACIRKSTGWTCGTCGSADPEHPSPCPAAPKRIQRKRERDWRKPDGVIDVTRSGRWGNPFRIGDPIPEGPFREVFGDTVKDAQHAVDIFRSYATVTPGYEHLARHELAGSTLMCWCKPGQPCHGDVLLAIANTNTPQENP